MIPTSGHLLLVAQPRARCRNLPLVGGQVVEEVLPTGRGRQRRRRGKGLAVEHLEEPLFTSSLAGIFLVEVALGGRVEFHLPEGLVDGSGRGRTHRSSGPSRWKRPSSSRPKKVCRKTDWTTSSGSTRRASRWLIRPRARARRRSANWSKSSWAACSFPARHNSRSLWLSVGGCVSAIWNLLGMQAPERSSDCVIGTEILLQARLLYKPIPQRRPAPAGLASPPRERTT